MKDRKDFLETLYMYRRKCSAAQNMQDYVTLTVHKLPSMPHTHQKSRTSLFPQAQNVTKSSFQKEFNQSDFFGLIGTSDIPPFKKKIGTYNVHTG